MGRDWGEGVRRWLLAVERDPKVILIIPEVYLNPSPRCWRAWNGVATPRPHLFQHLVSKIMLRPAVSHAHVRRGLREEQVCA